MKEQTPFAVRLRKRILEVNCLSQEGHVPTSLSVVECMIAAELFMGSTDAFVSGFVLSKGHASLGLYAFLESRGLLTAQELDDFAAKGSSLGGHPTRSEKVLFASGSLGHGLPLAAGLAHARSLLDHESKEIVCLVGDGELNEGSNWEAMILSSRLRLANLYLLVDDNQSSKNGSEMLDISSKLKAFGFDTSECDGHSVKDISSALNALRSSASTKPKALIARTMKGKGIKTMEESPEKWHHSPINSEELSVFLEELGN